MLTALFGPIYIDAAPRSNTWCDVILALTLAKCAGFSSWPPAIAMLCLMRLRIQRNLRHVNDFTIINRVLIKRIGPHVTYGIAAYTTRPVLAWWIAAHLALGPWGTPALLYATKSAKPPDALQDQDRVDYDAYVELRRRRICEKIGC